MDDENEPIIIDNGSGKLKAGFADDDSPKCIFPTVIGVPKAPGILVGMDQKDYYVGKEALSKKQVLNLTEPIQHGLIVELDDMFNIWNHLMNNELRVSPEDHKIFMTEPPKNPKANRTALTKKMFEEFHVNKFYLQNQAVLSLYASGKTTGTVVDWGYGISHTVPIYEGYAIPHAIREFKIAGRELTDYLKQQLLQKGFEYSSSSNNLDVINDIKESQCFVANDFDAEHKTALDKVEETQVVYALPKGSITLNLERIQTPEYMFQPTKNDKTFDGIHKFTHDSIMKWDADIKRDLFRGIVLAGGSTMFKGMKRRMIKEIQALAPSPMGPQVEAPADRKFSCWLGAAILSKIKAFNDIWITKQEYDEDPENIVHRKCF